MTTLRRCPKGARIELANFLTEKLKDVTSSNSVLAWQTLLILPYATLQVPSKTDNVKNLTTWVKSNIANFSPDILPKI
jgi:hypothetical protein